MVTSAPRGDVTSRSPFAPFRHRVFFWLWLGVVISSVGTWGQTVGAQWLFVNDPNAATIVPLVQTASTLPMMVLALPAGVLADAFDRRLMMLAVQTYVVVVAVLLAVLTALNLMPPALLLAFTFAVGAGQAMLQPPWQALITELVPRSEFAAATRLDMVSVNVSRAAGPAIAGVVIAFWGVPPVFALNAAATTFLIAVLLLWRRPATVRNDRERFLPALRAGGRYVRHEPVIRTMLMRFVTFVFPAGAVWALLPLIASRQLSAGAGGYGLLFSARGGGRAVRARPGRPRVHELDVGGDPAAGGVWVRLVVVGRDRDRRAAALPSRLGPGARPRRPFDGLPWHPGRRRAAVGTSGAAVRNTGCTARCRRDARRQHGPGRRPAGAGQPSARPVAAGVLGYPPVHPRTGANHPGHGVDPVPGRPGSPSRLPGRHAIHAPIPAPFRRHQLGDLPGR